jgi:class 3 adenylate cyclase
VSQSQERVQRRLEAIMFADVVGYSRLTGQVLALIGVDPPCAHAKGLPN